MKKIVLLILLLSLTSCASNNIEPLPSGSVGNLIVETLDEQKKDLGEEEKVFLLQQKERDRQQRDLEDLERQKYYNEKIKSYGLE